MCFKDGWVPALRRSANAALHRVRDTDSASRIDFTFQTATIELVLPVIASQRVARMRARCIQPSSSAKADDPVFQHSSNRPRSRGVLDTRFRGYDDRE